MNIIPDMAALDTCDREIIHTPGAIQPHGLMLVADRDGVVRNVAGRIEDRLGVTRWQNEPLTRLIGSGLARQALSLVMTSGGAGGFVGQLSAAGGETLDLTVHASGGHIILELEPASTEGLSAARVMDRITASSAALARSAFPREVCDRAAVEFRRLTGFDRVMVYRFNADGAGEVLAEDRRSDMHAFLHHHFPKSDIPAQARALYVNNVVRVIADASYEPAPLRPEWTAPHALDMTNSSLRSVSPIHLQYLRNMGVGASASFSIVIDGGLWGLIACHHQLARMLSYDVRSACRALAETLSRQIEAAEEAEGLRQRIRLRSFEDSIVAVLAGEGMFNGDLSGHLGKICRMMDGDGIAVLHGQDMICSGSCPDQGEVRQLGAWLMAGSPDPIFSTDQLSAQYPAASRFTGCCSGILSLLLSVDESWLIIWFRAEQLEVVNWAGNPHKAQSAGLDEPLNPRASFDTWSQQVRGRSRRWSRAEIDAAARLGTSLLDVQRVCRLSELNLQLTRVLQDKDRLIRHKDFLVGEINHRMQNSLQLVSSFLLIQARESTQPVVEDALQEARRRLSAVALVHRRLYRGDQIEMVNLARYIEELCNDTIRFMGEDWSRLLSLDLAPASIPADVAINLGLILTELLINANKHAYGGFAGPVRVQLAEDSTRLRLSVGDRGSGGSADDSGYGSRMIAGLVAQLGGVMTRSDNRPGLLVAISLPAGGRPQRTYDLEFAPTGDLPH
jgi:chemotaxis family two-component system sensor kinase Cph1